MAIVSRTRRVPSAGWFAAMWGVELRSPKTAWALVRATPAGARVHPSQRNHPQLDVGTL